MLLIFISCRFHSTLFSPPVLSDWIAENTLAMKEKPTEEMFGFDLCVRCSPLRVAPTVILAGIPARSIPRFQIYFAFRFLFMSTDFFIKFFTI